MVFKEIQKNWLLPVKIEEVYNWKLYNLIISHYESLEKIFLDLIKPIILFDSCTICMLNFIKIVLTVWILLRYKQTYKKIFSLRVKICRNFGDYRLFVIIGRILVILFRNSLNLNISLFIFIYFFKVMLVIYPFIFYVNRKNIINII